MDIKNSENDLWGSYIVGLSYTAIIAIILLLICFVIDDSLFDSSLTFIIIGAFCIAFFIGGLKKVEENNLGFVRYLGRRDFSQYYSEGYWWIFPLATFKQKPNIETLNDSEEIKLSVISKDGILLDIAVSYTWQLNDPKLHDTKFQANSVKRKLVFELSKFIKSREAIEILSDIEISERVMGNFLRAEGEKIGLTIVDVFPNIQHGEHSNTIAKEYEKKYNELKFQLDQLTLKSSDMQIYQDQVKNCIKDLGFSNEEALNFIKVYKNNVNLSENKYEVNIGELNKSLETIINIFKK